MFLEFATTSKNIPHLPSWVPDWTVLARGHKLDIDLWAVSDPNLINKSKPSRGWYLDQWDPAHPKFLEKIPIDKVQYPGGGAALRINASRIFSCSGGRLTCTALPNQPLDLTHFSNFQEALKSLSIREPWHDIHCFCLLQLGRVALLRKHANNFFSLLQLCSISYQRRDGRGLALPFDSLQLFIYDSVCFYRDSKILETWVLEVIFLSMRNQRDDVLPNCMHWQTYWSYNLKHSIQPCQRSEVEPGAHINSTRLCRSMYDTMKQIRAKILDLITTDDLTCLISSGEHSAHSPHRKVFHLFPLEKPGDSFIAQNVENLLYDEFWSMYSHSPDKQVSDWHAYVDELCHQISKHDQISKAFEDSSLLGSQRVFCITNASIGDKPLHFVLCPILTEKEMKANVVEIREGEVMYRAWKFIESLNLDFEMPWEWNRDRLGIHIATLKLVVEVLESLLERRLSARIQYGARNPETIVLV